MGLICLLGAADVAAVVGVAVVGKQEGMHEGRHFRSGSIDIVGLIVRTVFIDGIGDGTGDGRIANEILEGTL